ncbi:hypothetical protein ACVWYG_001972 [Pedobacter sp. UYEF25]
MTNVCILVFEVKDYSAWIFATGRATANNELVEIGTELQKFITHINKTEK